MITVGKKLSAQHYEHHLQATSGAVDYAAELPTMVLEALLTGLEINPLTGPYTLACRQQLHDKICAELERRYGV